MQSMPYMRGNGKELDPRGVDAWSAEEVIRHQAIRMDDKPETLDRFMKRLQKPLPITIIAIDWLTVVAAGRDMIHGVFKLYSDRACHNANYDTATRCQVSRVAPESASGRATCKQCASAQASQGETVRDLQATRRQHYHG